MILRLTLAALALLFAIPSFAQSNITGFNSTESTFFMQSGAERGYALCPSADGNFYIAGKRNDQLALIKMTPEGEYLFVHLIDVFPGSQTVAAALIVDSEGNLVVCGNAQEDAVSTGFVLRYDPDTRTILWAKVLEGDQTLVHGVLEDGPGGDFFLYGNPHFPGGDDAELLKLDRNTGEIIPGWAFRYNLGTSENFSAMVLDKNGLYAVGRFTDGLGNGAFSDMRHTLVKINPATGQAEWTRLSPVDSAKSARLYGKDLVVDQDAIISTFSGSDVGPSLDPTHIFLQKTTTDGDLVWVKKYDLIEWNTEFAEELISVDDGYVILGRTLVEDEGWIFLLKTDKDGNPLWAKKFEHEYNNDLIGTAQGQLIALGDYLYFTGYTEHLPTNSRMFLIKTAADGTVSDNCDALVPTDVSMEAVADPFDYAVDPDISHSSVQTLDQQVPSPLNSMLTQLFVCRKEGLDDCQTLPDITFTIDSIACSGGKIRFYYTECNLGGAPVGSFLVRSYFGDPTKTAAQEFAAGLILNNTDLMPGECRSGVYLSVSGADLFPAGLNGSQELFFVANHGSGWTTPFSLDSFPSTNIIECDYSNNLSSFVITNNPSGPDLGPDVILCNDTTIVFDAGAGFASYLWQNGSTARTLTATDPGIYWVQVTDQCGFTYSDSVFFSFSLLPDIQFPDTAICPGGSLLYAVPGFDQYSWAPSDGLSCTDCPTVTIQPDVTTQYTLLASDDLGCVLRDTFLVEIISGPSNLDLECPANITVQADPGAASAVVNYDDPLAASDCPCGDAGWIQTQGLISGAAFPLGQTSVCFEAEDGCNTTKSCCFTVTVEKTLLDEPCDVKETPCVRFEILGIFQNPQKQKTYRMRVINKCAAPLVYVAYQLPGGLNAVQPASNSVYNSPAGRQYEVRNPNPSPFHSIRFKSIGPGIKSGESDVFEYTLPSQADPTFIHAVAKLEPQSYYETHLNVFACEIQSIANRPDAGAGDRNAVEATGTGITVFPNPVTNTLYADLSGWQNQRAHVMVHNVFGQALLDEIVQVPEGDFALELPNRWADGLYIFTVVSENGEHYSARFRKMGR